MLGGQLHCLLSAATRGGLIGLSVVSLSQALHEVWLIRHLHPPCMYTLRKRIGHRRSAMNQ